MNQIVDLGADPQRRVHRREKKIKPAEAQVKPSLILATKSSPPPDLHPVDPRIEPVRAQPIGKSQHPRFVRRRVTADPPPDIVATAAAAPSVMRTHPGNKFEQTTTPVTAASDRGLLSPRIAASPLVQIAVDRRMSNRLGLPIIDLATGCSRPMYRRRSRPAPADGIEDSTVVIRGST